MQLPAGYLSNGNTDNYTGQPMFFLDACSGQVRVLEDNPFDYYLRVSVYHALHSRRKRCKVRRLVITQS
jgi:hypothetical protein